MATSLQDILKRRQQEQFVGREEQLAFFHRNLGLAPENSSHRSTCCAPRVRYDLARLVLQRYFRQRPSRRSMVRLR